MKQFFNFLWITLIVISSSSSAIAEEIYLSCESTLAKTISDEEKIIESETTFQKGTIEIKVDTLPNNKNAFSSFTLHGHFLPKEMSFFTNYADPKAQHERKVKDTSTDRYWEFRETWFLNENDLVLKKFYLHRATGQLKVHVSSDKDRRFSKKTIYDYLYYLTGDCVKVESGLKF